MPSGIRQQDKGRFWPNLMDQSSYESTPQQENFHKPEKKKKTEKEITQENYYCFKLKNS